MDFHFSDSVSGVPENSEMSHRMAPLPNLETAGIAWVESVIPPNTIFKLWQQLNNVNSALSKQKSQGRIQLAQGKIKMVSYLLVLQNHK